MSDSFATPWTVACQAPLSVGFSRQEYWSGLPFPPPGVGTDRSGLISQQMWLGTTKVGRLGLAHWGKGGSLLCNCQSGCGDFRAAAATLPLQEEYSLLVSGKLEAATCHCYLLSEHCWDIVELTNSTHIPCSVRYAGSFLSSYCCWGNLVKCLTLYLVRYRLCWDPLILTSRWVCVC